MAGEPDDPLLDTGVRRVVARADERHPYGRPGRPVGERSAFRLALVASIGVGLAFELIRALVAVREVLLLAAVALVLAIGLERPVALLSRRMPRGIAVLAVVSAFLGLFVAFLAAGFRGEEAFQAGVSEEQALDTVLPRLSPERARQLANERRCRQGTPHNWPSRSVKQLT